jgi:hypothetical protein
MKQEPWVGVDLDGTLAEYKGGVSPEHIGPPVPKMVELIKSILAEDIEVRIFTARVAGDRDGIDPRTTKKLIQDWLEKECGLPRLEVTNIKEFNMVELYDDRAVQVEFNTGELVGHSTMEHRQLLKKD